jgi:branched-chain amino acid transport system substrate-binding protein
MEVGTMARKALVAVSAFLLLAVACKSSGGEAGAQSTTVRFGAALSLTGQLSREGVLTKEGYEYCKKVVNEKGGIKAGGKSYKLDILYQDDRSSPDVAAQLVDQMNDKGVKFMLGPYGSSSTEAASAVTERNQQVMISSAGADDKIFEKGYKYVFGVLSPASQYLATIVKATADIAQPKPQTVGIVSADDGFSKTAAEGGKAEAEKQGMQVVAMEFVPEGSTDVSSALTKVKAKNPDLILGAVHLQEGIAIMKQSKELGLAPKVGFGETVAPPTPDFAKTLGSTAEGVLGSSQWTPQVQGSDNVFGTAQDYTSGFEQAIGHTPEYHNAEATAACLAMVKAIEKAGSTDSSKVRDALAGLSMPSFFGTIRFNPQGKNIYKPMAVIQIQSGKPVTVWPQAPGTEAAVWPASPFGA